MTDNSPTDSAGRARSARTPVAARLQGVIAGAAAAAILWACALLLGLPRIAGFENGHDFVVPAAAIGALLSFTALRRAIYVATAVAVLAVAVVAYTPVVERPVHTLVRVDPRPVVPSGAVVVLGADIAPDSLLHTQSLDRMLGGLELMRAGAAPVLVIPGNTVTTRGRVVSARPDQMRLAALAGLDTATILVADRVHSTRDEAVRASELLRPRGIRRIHVVTSPAHTGRACRTFERVGFLVTCTPSRSRDVPFTAGSLYRSPDRLEAFGLWVYERAAMALYHMKGWV